MKFVKKKESRHLIQNPDFKWKYQDDNLFEIYENSKTKEVFAYNSYIGGYLHTQESWQQLKDPNRPNAIQEEFGFGPNIDANKHLRKIRETANLPIEIDRETLIALDSRLSKLSRQVWNQLKGDLAVFLGLLAQKESRGEFKSLYCKDGKSGYWDIQIIRHKFRLSLIGHVEKSLEGRSKPTLAGLYSYIEELYPPMNNSIFTRIARRLQSWAKYDMATMSHNVELTRGALMRV